MWHVSLFHWLPQLLNFLRSNLIHFFLIVWGLEHKVLSAVHKYVAKTILHLMHNGYFCMSNRCCNTAVAKNAIGGTGIRVTNSNKWELENESMML